MCKKNSEVDNILDPWPEDLVERLKDADFEKAFKMLCEGQKILYGWCPLNHLDKRREDVRQLRKSDEN